MEANTWCIVRLALARSTPSTSTLLTWEKPCITRTIALQGLQKKSVCFRSWLWNGKCTKSWPISCASFSVSPSLLSLSLLMDSWKFEGKRFFYINPKGYCCCCCCCCCCHPCRCCCCWRHRPCCCCINLATFRKGKCETQKKFFSGIWREGRLVESPRVTSGRPLMSFWPLVFFFCKREEWEEIRSGFYVACFLRKRIILTLLTR